MQANKLNTVNELVNALAARWAEINKPAIVTELFKPGQGQEWKWEYLTKDVAEALFKVGEIPYQFQASMFRSFEKDSPSGLWQLEFKALDRWYNQYKLTGTGNSAQVMSTVVDIIRDFLTRYKSRINQIVFNAREDSRQSLYAKIAARILPDWKLSTQDSSGVGKPSGTKITLTSPIARF